MERDGVLVLVGCVGVCREGIVNHDPVCCVLADDGCGVRGSGHGDGGRLVMMIVDAASGHVGVVSDGRVMVTGDIERVGRGTVIGDGAYESAGVRENDVGGVRVTVDGSDDGMTGRGTDDIERGVWVKAVVDAAFEDVEGRSDDEIQVKVIGGKSDGEEVERRGVIADAALGLLEVTESHDGYDDGRVGMGRVHDDSA